MAITTKAEYKTHRGIADTNYDDLVDAYIPAIQQRLERYCGRLFDSAERTEKYSGTGTQVLVVRNGPVTAISSVVVAYGTSSTTLTANTEYRAAEGNSNWIYRLPFNDDIGLVGADSDGFPSSRSRSVGPVWPKGHENITVTYTGGFTTIPDDLKALVWVMLDDAIQTRGKAWSEHATGQGNQNWTARAAGDVSLMNMRMFAPWRHSL